MSSVPIRAEIMPCFLRYLCPQNELTTSGALKNIVAIKEFNLAEILISTGTTISQKTC
jgi:hypothetical protein